MSRPKPRHRPLYSHWLVEGPKPELSLYNSLRGVRNYSRLNHAISFELYEDFIFVLSGVDLLSPRIVPQQIKGVALALSRFQADYQACEGYSLVALLAPLKSTGYLGTSLDGLEALVEMFTKYSELSATLMAEY
jgi:hypothetical protein